MNLIFSESSEMGVKYQKYNYNKPRKPLNGIIRQCKDTFNN